MEQKRPADIIQELLDYLWNRSDVDIIVNACEAHLHIPMADFVVYVVVAAPVKPDLILSLIHI